MIKSSEALKILQGNTRDWMSEEPSKIPQARRLPLRDLLTGLHECNFYSWKADDRSRGDLAPEVIVKFKRELDASNLMRNHFMEEIDSAVVAELKLSIDRSDEGLTLNSETVGQMLDRLSVLTLKREFAAHRLNADQTTSALDRINRQLSYVARCYDEFVDGLRAGRAHMLAYKQYKMYEPD